MKIGVRRSQYFLPTLREEPAEASVVSHRLMLRAGLIRQASAGLYNWLPLGFRVLKKIEAIVRVEQDRIGAHECLMPTIQSADLWKKSGRYDDYGKEMLRITDRHDASLLYGPTNEEAITQLFADTVKSYKDLPCRLYHIQWKFRDEIRPRFGVMRAREFYMKDAYSFDADEEQGMASYRAMAVSYLRIFERMGLTAVPMRAETGPIGGDNSHEFVVLAKTGESAVYCDSTLLDQRWQDTSANDARTHAELFARATSCYAATDEEHDADHFAAKVPAARRLETRGIEVGHVFFFADKYSRPLEARVATRKGANVPVAMGSYGVGISRLVAAAIEASHDANGIVWHDSIAPFSVNMISLAANEKERQEADALYQTLCREGIETLYDDRLDVRAGVKFNEADLLGLPWQIVVGDKSPKDNVELKRRDGNERQILPLDKALAQVRKSLTQSRRHDPIFD